MSQTRTREFLLGLGKRRPFTFDSAVVTSLYRQGVIISEIRNFETLFKNVFSPPRLSWWVVEMTYA